MLGWDTRPESRAVSASPARGWFAGCASPASDVVLVLPRASAAGRRRMRRRDGVGSLEIVPAFAGRGREGSRGAPAAALAAASRRVDPYSSMPVSRRPAPAGPRGADVLYGPDLVETVERYAAAAARDRGAKATSTSSMLTTGSRSPPDSRRSRPRIGPSSRTSTPPSSTARARPAPALPRRSSSGARCRSRTASSRSPGTRRGCCASATASARIASGSCTTRSTPLLPDEAGCGAGAAGAPLSFSSRAG